MQALTLADLARLGPWEAVSMTKGRVVLGPPPNPNRPEYPFKGSLIFQGIPVYIENPVGDVRRGKDADGHPWETKMVAHYGEIAHTAGLDGDAVDVFVGPNSEAPTAYVVHQKVPGTQRPDEDKVILGCDTEEEAEQLYRAHYDRPGFFQGITPWPVDELREYLASGAHHGKRLDSPRRVRALVKARIKGKPGLHLDPAKHRWVLDHPKLAPLVAQAQAMTEPDHEAMASLYQRLHRVAGLHAYAALTSALEEAHPDEYKRPDPEEYTIFSHPDHTKHAFRRAADGWLPAFQRLGKQEHWDRGGEWAEKRKAYLSRRDQEEAENDAWESQGVEIDESSPPPLSKLRGKKVWLYHGTSSTSLEDIKREGLRGDRQRANYGGTGDQRHTQAVFLTARATGGHSSAEFYARQAAFKMGGDPVILRVLVDGSDLDHDPDDHDISAGRFQYVVDQVDPSEIKEIDGERQGELRKGKGQQFARPEGEGWEPIPKGRKGGYRKRHGQGWVYWYADQHPHEAAARRHPWSGMHTAGAPEALVHEVAENIVRRATETAMGRDGKPVEGMLRFGKPRTLRIYNYDKGGREFEFTRADGQASSLQVILDVSDQIHGYVEGGLGTNNIDGANVLLVRVPTDRATSPDAWGEEIRGVVAHEFAHAADPGREHRKSKVPTTSAAKRYEPGSEEAWRDYYNDPSEVVARRHEILRDVNTPRIADIMRSVHEKGKSRAETVALALLTSSAWRDIRHYLTPENRRRIQTAVAQVVMGHLDGTSTPMEKGKGQEFARPEGAGWEPIPKGRHGGYRRRNGKGWEYWYADQHAHQQALERTHAFTGRGTLGVSEEDVRMVADRIMAMYQPSEEHGGKRKLRGGGGGVGAVRVVRPDGTERQVPVRVFAHKPGSWQANQNQISGHYQWSRYGGSKANEPSARFGHNVQINVPDVWEGRFDPAENIRRTLAHELTHVADPDLERNGTREREPTSGDDEFGIAAERRYYNDPAEFTAFRHNIFRELNTPDIAQIVKNRTKGMIHRDSGYSEADIEEEASWDDDPVKQEATRQRLRERNRMVDEVPWQGGPHVTQYLVDRMLDANSPTWNRLSHALTPANRTKVKLMVARLLAAHLDGTSSPMEKGAPLRLLKAVIRTPRKAEGGVDYDSVPVGASIWVTVTDPASPLHGRPILITKRPDHQFALTGGAGSSHIEARRHMALQGGAMRENRADEALAARRREVEERNAPKKAVVKAYQRDARKEQRAAESAFMEALGIRKKGLGDEEKAKVQATARTFAEQAGLEGRDAAHFARLLADGLAKKDQERRVKQAARRLEVAQAIVHGKSPEEAQQEAGPDLGALELTPPPVNSEEWADMTDSEREAHVNAHLDEQVAQQEEKEREAWRFEDDGHDHDGDLVATPNPAALPDVEETPRTTMGEVQGGGGPDQAIPTEIPAGVEPTAQYVQPPQGDVTLAQPDLGPATVKQKEPPAGETPTFKVGHEEPPVEALDQDEEEAPAAPQYAKPILSREAAERAVDSFRRYASSRKAAAEASSTLESMPEGEPATPAALEELRLHAGAVSDEELDRFLQEYVTRNSTAVDTAFYGALTPHWNEDAGNKLAGAITTGAASAITGIVGEENAGRYDVQNLVDALGPEAAAVAVASRLRDDLGDEGYGRLVEKLRRENPVNIRGTERTALERHRELQRQAAELEGQVSAGDLKAETTVAVLRARNLIEQRENLGTALGSMQASAALFDAMERGQSGRKKRAITINVAGRAAMEDKLARLGKFRHSVRYDVATGNYAIQTDTDALRKYVGRTEANHAHDEAMRAVKYDSSGIEPDEEGREWVPSYTVPGFRPHFAEAETLPSDLQHLAGRPIRLMADQRNNIEWLHKSGGGLVSMRTGGGKTLVSLGVAGKMLAENPRGRHLRIVPDGREEQWAAEARSFTNIPVVVLPAKSKKEERQAILAAAPEGAVVVVGHRNAGRYDHQALATVHKWDSIGIDEPQELRSASGSGKMGAGARRIFKIPAANRHALTATPASENPVEAYDIVNWARPGVLGFRTRFQRSFTGFGGGTNAQDAALQRVLYRELEPHISADRQVRPHYGVEHVDHGVTMSESQRTRQRQIEEGAGDRVEAAVQEAYRKKREGVHGYADAAWAALRKQATERVMGDLEREHRENLGAGTTEHNPRLRAVQRQIGEAPNQRHVVFVDSPEQRRAVVDLVGAMGRPTFNIDATARGATRRGADGLPVSAIEARKRDWKASKNGVIVIDRTSASGHNLAEGHHLHVLGDPDDAAQLLQVHGRLGRANREGDFTIHTYRHEDSPFSHHTWNRLNRQIKILRATAPGLFVEGRKRDQGEALLAKGLRLVVRAIQQVRGRP